MFSAQTEVNGKAAITRAPRIDLIFIGTSTVSEMVEV
jgi:hypothetical protein